MYEICGVLLHVLSSIAQIKPETFWLCKFASPVKLYADYTLHTPVGEVADHSRRFHEAGNI
jgi:hypothetical protein